MLIKPGGSSEASEVRPKSAGWRGMGTHMETVLVVLHSKLGHEANLPPPFLLFSWHLGHGSHSESTQNVESQTARYAIAVNLIRHHQWGGGGNPSRRALKLDLGSRVLQMLLLFSLSFFIFYYSILFYFIPVCGILAPQRKIQPATPALGVWGLNPWTSREIPQLNFFNKGAWMLLGNYGHVGLRKPQQPFPSLWSSTSKVKWKH